MNLHFLFRQTLDNASSIDHKFVFVTDHSHNYDTGSPLAGAADSYLPLTLLL